MTEQVHRLRPVYLTHPRTEIVQGDMQRSLQMGLVVLPVGAEVHHGHIPIRHLLVQLIPEELPDQTRPHVPDDESRHVHRILR